VWRLQFGIVLSDEWHRPVFAATTAWRHRDTGTFEAGSQVEARLALENLLAGGSYLISPEVMHDGSPRQVIDHREHAARLNVSGGRHGAGIVDLPHEFALQRAETLETTGDR
jgi:hypothetical protein